jgi:hypothetical protein
VGDVGCDDGCEMADLGLCWSTSGLRDVVDQWVVLDCDDGAKMVVCDKVMSDLITGCEDG